MKSLLRMVLATTLILSVFAVVIPAGAQDEIVITQWYHQYGEEGTYEAALAYAEEYSEMTDGVRVEVEWVPGDYVTKLNSALLAGEGPDVFEINFPPIRMVQAGQLEPLTDLYTDEILADFPESVINRVTVDNDIYGLPMIVDIFHIFYYRVSAFEEAGIEVPATFKEFKAAAEALTSGRVKGLFLGNGGGLSYHVSNSLVWSDNGSVIEDGEIVFANERTAEMWESMLELSTSDGLLDGAATNWWDASVFNNGQANIQMSGLWAMPGIMEQWGDDVGVFPWPAYDEDGSPVVIVNGWWQVVNSASENTDAAKAYVDWLWLQSTENQIDWALNYGFHIPPRLSAAGEAEALAEGLPAQAAMFFAEYGKDAFPQGWTDDMQITLQDAFSAALFQGEEVEAALARAQEDIQAAYDELYAE